MRVVVMGVVACVDPPVPVVDSGGQTATSVPTEDLAAWLAEGEYLEWPSEDAPHPSAGPHFGQVRTWLSPALAASLAAGDPLHPVGSAAVKELYGDGDTARGYSVLVRVGDGAGDNAWYWYERFDGTTYADGRGVALCAGCHAAGVDQILTEWPP